MFSSLSLIKSNRFGLKRVGSREKIFEEKNSFCAVAALDVIFFNRTLGRV